MHELLAAAATCDHASVGDGLQTIAIVLFVVGIAWVLFR